MNSVYAGIKSKQRKSSGKSLSAKLKSKRHANESSRASNCPNDV